MREEFVDETVMVQARFMPGDRVQPTAFIWRGRTRYLVGLGRQWVEDAPGGAWHCFLAETVAGDIVELRWHGGSQAWRLWRAWWREQAA